MPLVVDLEFSVDRYIRAYGGVGTPLGSYGSRTNFNLLDPTKPKSFGFKSPSFAFGWFANRDNKAADIKDAMEGANVSGQVPFLPVGVGVTKSLPNGNGFWSSPTAVEIGTPGAGAGISGSQEIPCAICDELREKIRRLPFNPNSFQRDKPQQ